MTARPAVGLGHVGTRAFLPTMDAVGPRWDVAVVGAGFGGLATALRLAERGARVVLCERLNYPGGCASTFRHDGYRFESGATLFSGLAPGQLFGHWIERHGLDVTVDWLDPLVSLRTPDLRLEVTRRREALREQFEAMPGAPVGALRGFFARQTAVADALWSLLDDPSLLPPFGASALLRHAARLPRYLPVVRTVGRSLGDVLRHHALDRFAPLRIYLDALCQITVQCAAAEAEAPFALGTMDYYYRGTGHVRGGIGRLADALVGAIRGLGGTVELACAVRGITRDPGGWRLDTRRGSLRAAQVVANVLPRDLGRLAPGVADTRSLRALTADVEGGWGACMLYLVVDDADLHPAPHHLQLIHDPDQPFQEGNHVFCSVSGAADTGRAPAGQRTVTVSTHVPLPHAATRPAPARGAYIASVQERMRATIAALAPELSARVRHGFTASPRTFERFTGRSAGFVGGIPRRRGWGHYTTAFHGPVAPGLHLVGDSIFPGQSTLAAALGGVRLAERLH